MTLVLVRAEDDAAAAGVGPDPLLLEPCAQPASAMAVTTEMPIPAPRGFLMVMVTCDASSAKGPMDGEPDDGEGFVGSPCDDLMSAVAVRGRQVQLLNS
jgi:hypothetical protein